MNKKEFTVLKSWFQKAKPVLRTQPLNLRVEELFMVKTSYDEIFFSNAKEPVLRSVEKRFPEYYHQVGEAGFLNRYELDALFTAMGRNKDLRSLMV